LSGSDLRRGIVYRLYDTAGALLYVGSTVNLDQRFQFHRRDKPWWPDVAGKRLDFYDRYPEAREAERCAILSEDPVHNVSGTPRMAEVLQASQRRHPDTGPSIRELMEQMEPLYPTRCAWCGIVVVARKTDLPVICGGCEEFYNCDPPMPPPYPVLGGTSPVVA
jgi:hypothetical protein